MSYFTNNNLFERSVNIYYAQSFDNFVDYIKLSSIKRTVHDYFAVSTHNYVDRYSIELLNYVFGSEEFDDIDMDFLY